MNVKFVFLFAVAALAVASVATAAEPEEHNDVFTLIVAHLNKFQSQDGGFVRNGRENPSVEATERALFLTSLFGTRARINAYEASRFVEGALNSDNGYGSRAGASSTAEATYAAVLSYLYLGQSVPNPENIASFVESLWDANSSLFAATKGGHGDLKSTALALLTLKHTGALESGFVKGISASIRATLGEKLQSGADGSYFAFDNEAGLTATSANYYATVAASLVGYKFGKIADHAKYVNALQCLDETSPGNFGGFYTDSSRSAVQFVATGDAMATLKVLADLDKKVNYANSVDSEALSSFVAGAPEDIGDLASCHYAIAVTDAFTSNFKETMLYDVEGQPIKSSFVQGSQFKPVFALTYGGVPHGGIDVDVTITPPSARAEKADGETFKLALNQENQIYIADELYDTDEELGAISFEFTARYYVVGVGDISFKFSDEKNVGYKVSIDAKATLNGEEVESTDVQIGTEFEATVTLSTRQDAELLAGDFTVAFDVVDAAGASISNQKKQGKGNTEPYTFSYALKDGNIPAGALSLRIQVSGADGVVHSEESVAFSIDLTMVATDITVTDYKSGKAPTFKLGQKISASFVPASLPDLRTPQRFAAAQKDGRKFFLDFVSGDKVVASVGGKGSDAKGNSKYSFDYTIPADLDHIGEGSLAFRFVDAEGNSHTLSAFDDEIQSAPIGYSVNTKLELADVTTKPKTSTFDYGSTVNFAFKVKDSVSGKFVQAGKADGSTAHLALTSNGVRSVHIPAAASGDSFTINWPVNANAVAGKSVLSLDAQNPAGQTVAINENGKPYQMNVKVGGTIDVAYTTYAQTNPDSARSFIVTSFTLACKGNDLPGADLRANVIRAGQVVAENVPVTSDGTQYQVTYSANHKDAAAGTYKIAVFRESDRQASGSTLGTDDTAAAGTAADSDDFSSGTITKGSATVAESSSQKVLFVSTVSYGGQASRPIIQLRIEYFAVLALGALFYYVNQQKNAISL
eukprot:TRINITY_DN3870_c0_g6_i2.p1 TRINITY_DN3870_c0_g6~~TRINITY_DN3870_c0_g6_i2.p1  ORF type:complete len:982 (-),score=423.79 TRINITY_DN3870_c0_g6_i2:1608-4553(-)